MSEACCGPHPLNQNHLESALSSVKENIEPAHHLRSKSSDSARKQAEVIVLGQIVTNNPKMPTAEAMAVSGGEIIAIGSRADVEALTSPATKTLRPDGVIIPGLIEPHMHIWTSLLNLSWIDVSHETCPTFDDVVSALKETAGKTPRGEYVLGKLFDPSRYPGEPVLTRNILDQVSQDHPILVMNASQHYMYANSLAFENAGINDQTPDPEGGTLLRADGRLTGVIGEASAMMMVIEKLPKPTTAETTAGIRQILNECAAQGVTSLRESATGTISGVGELALLHQMNAADRLPVRVSTAQFALMAGKTVAEVAATWREAGVTPFSGDEMVRADAWKIVTDGSNQGRSGYFLQPYLGEISGGHANWTPESLREAMKVGLDDGWQLMVHTNGDAAVEMALEALEELLPQYEQSDLRHRFEHASFTTEDQLHRMAKAGIEPSFLMNHVYYWGAAFRDTILGAARANRLDRVASAYAAGLRPSFHSDYNVSKVHPLQSARTAVLRQLQADGQILNPAERATPAQALAGITTNAAYHIHADDRGSLEVGKRADFAVVDVDPWSSDPEGWDRIKVHATAIDGEMAYEA